MRSRLELEVDLEAVRANARTLVRAAGAAELWAVLKADGYGHGAVACARAALDGGATRLCVATLAEAERLRTAVGAAVPVLVLSPLRPGEEARAAGFEVCVSTPGALGRLAAAGVRCAVHVKADTGMGRWGLDAAAALEAGRALAAGAHPGLRLAGLMSHLATADADPAFVALQVDRFRELAAVFPPCPRHLGNSAAALIAPAAHHDALRCGIALYGVSPFDRDPAEHGLRPALRLTSSVVALRRLGVGDSSGYGRRLIADRPLVVALVPVGYADGYPRILSGQSDVLVGGRRRRVAATISMDQLTAVVDDDVAVGDEVVLVGRQGAERVGPEELARLAGTIGYELCCGLAPRADRGARSYRGA